MKRHRGFTLLEVLVALTIIGIGLISVVKMTGESANGTQALSERIRARWVAQNVIAQARLDMPVAGEAEGNMVISGAPFTWRRVITATGNSKLHRIQVEVFTAAGPPALITLQAVLFSSYEI